MWRNELLAGAPPSLKFLLYTCGFDLHLFASFPSDSPMPVTSRVCFVKFQEPESVGVSQHLTNTVFVDRALIVVPFAEGLSPVIVLEEWSMFQCMAQCFKDISYVVDQPDELSLIPQYELFYLNGTGNGI